MERIQKDIDKMREEELERNQKDINNIMNGAVQEILLDKDSTQNILNNANKSWKNLID